MPLAEAPLRIPACLPDRPRVTLAGASMASVGTVLPSGSSVPSADCWSADAVVPTPTRLAVHNADAAASGTR